MSVHPHLHPTRCDHTRPNPSATRRRSRRLAVGLLALASVVGASCSADDAANKALKDAGVNVNTKGGLPAGFPTEVPVPDLKIQTGLADPTGFNLRLTAPDAVADVTAYKATLKAAGFTISDEFDNTKGAGHNIGFTATGKGFKVIAVGFPKDTPVDANYLAVHVEKSA